MSHCHAIWADFGPPISQTPSEITSIMGELSKQISDFGNHVKTFSNIHFGPLRPTKNLTATFGKSLGLSGTHSKVILAILATFFVLNFLRLPQILQISF